MSFTGESSSPLKSKTAKGRCNDETGGFEGESGNSFGQMNGNSSEESIAVLESMAVTPKVRNKSWGRIASPLKSSEFNVEMGVKNSHTPRALFLCEENDEEKEEEEKREQEESETPETEQATISVISRDGDEEGQVNDREERDGGSDPQEPAPEGESPFQGEDNQNNAESRSKRGRKKAKKKRLAVSV